MNAGLSKCFSGFALMLCLAPVCAGQFAAVGTPDVTERLAGVVDGVVRPLMQAHDVPGVAVAVSVAGQQYYFNHGVTALEGGAAVSEHTLFEIGSLSKTFTATLVALAAEEAALELEDPASRHLPALAGSRFDHITVLQLGTYTAGGLPLQFPDEVKDEAGMVRYYRGWQASYEPGSHRLYSNPSLGLFGHLAAQSLGQAFEDAMMQRVFAPLAMKDSHYAVPVDRLADYAWGHDREGRPLRVRPGVFDAEAYGVKSSAADLLRFVDAQLGNIEVDAALVRAMRATRMGYVQIEAMTQGLGWEHYPYPVSLAQLQAGNAAQIVLEAQPAVRLQPPSPAAEDRLFNKTGATNGFGAYVVFVPAQRTGVVFLANRNLPTPVRVQAVHTILQALHGVDARAAAPTPR
ncbi:class C beta-lactamase [Parazoarcus communis]|nr:class C beta-lactamase [Parazoarcus communis]NMG71153.1 class C beta-lactamase [Parazoarcus communis SWub3 = DSM 12120]